MIGWRKEITFDFPDKLLQAMSLQCKSVYDKIIWKGKYKHMKMGCLLMDLILNNHGKKHFKIGKIMLPKNKKKGMS